MSFESLLNKTVSVQFKTVTSDHGTDTEAWAVAVASYKCRVYNVRPMLMRKITGEEVTISTKAAGFYDALIIEGCLLIDGVITYLIEAVSTKHGQSDLHHVEYGLRRVRDIGA